MELEETKLQRDKEIRRFFDFIRQKEIYLQSVCPHNNTKPYSMFLEIDAANAFADGDRCKDCGLFIPVDDFYVI